MFEFVNDIKQLVADIRSGDWISALKNAGKILPQIADIIGKLFPVSAVSAAEAQSYTDAVASLKAAVGECRAKPVTSSAEVTFNPLIAIVIIEELVKLLETKTDFVLSS